MITVPRNRRLIVAPTKRHFDAWRSENTQPGIIDVFVSREWDLAGQIFDPAQVVFLEGAESLRDIGHIRHRIDMQRLRLGGE